MWSQFWLKECDDEAKFTNGEHAVDMHKIIILIQRRADRIGCANTRTFVVNIGSTTKRTSALGRLM